MALPGVYKEFNDRWCKQTVWIYSDPHFADEELAAGVPGRPSADEQVKMINSCAGRQDTLIILGDVGDVEYVRKLRAANKILICGNHDAGSTNYQREIVQKIFDKDKVSRDEVRAIMEAEYPGWSIRIIEDYAFHSPFMRWVAYADNRLFDEVYEGGLIIGEKLILTHEPVEISWLFNIHGHDHAGAVRKGHLNVCSDVIGYKPVNLNAFLKSGPMAHIQSIHRITIDKATEKKMKRGGKKVGVGRSR